MNFSKTCKMSRMLFNKRNNPGDHLFKIVAARKPWICRGAAHIMVRNETIHFKISI